MRSYFRYAALSSFMCLALLAGCGDDESPSTTGTTTDTGTGGGGGDNTLSGNFIRVHYRLQDGGDATAWGAHFWGAGATEPPMWGSPQRFDQTDDFGAYTDIEITDTADSPDAWLGLIPVQCTDGNCKKDVETSVRWTDLQKNDQNPNIAECWIVQGQAVQKTKPESAGTPYKISRPRDFIDLGDGRVRLMFRVAPGSTGVVRYGADATTLDQQAEWTASDEINKRGLILDGLTPGQVVHYEISTTLQVEGAEPLTDEVKNLELTPTEFTTITDAADWAAWGSNGIMYQLIVRTFADGGTPRDVDNPQTDSGIDTATKDGIGDLVGLTSMLPYLADLGIDAIWMTPVFAAKSYHGYDTTDFYEIDPAVGTRKDFQDMATAADALGIKIVVDLVQNHVANVNPWFVAATDPNNPDFGTYHDWFVWSDEYSNMFTDPHPWDAQSVIWACTNYMCYHQIFGNAMPELNYHNPAVRDEMKKISEFWIDLGADGFRLDASKHIDQFDENNTVALEEHGTHVWWKEFNYFVKKGVDLPAGAPTVLLAGENRWDDPAVYGNMVPYGSDMDSQFDFPFRSIVASFAKGETGATADFVQYFNTLRTATANATNGGNANHFYQRFLSNHDLERPATQFEGVVTPELMHPLLEQLATIVMTVPGMPVIYYGEEVGKKGKRDKFVGDEPWDHDEHIREPMSWFSDLTFTGDMTSSYDIDFEATNAANASLGLEAGICKAPNPDYQYIKFMTDEDPNSWAAQKDVEDSLFNHYKKLIEIRKANPTLTASAAQLSTVQNTAQWYEFTVTNGTDQIRVVLNRQATAQTYNRVGVMDLLSDEVGPAFSVPPYGALILASPLP